MTHSTPSTVATVVPLAEAASLIARPENTIRDWIKKGFIRAKRDPKGRWWVEKDSLLLHASKTPTARATVKASSKARESVSATAVGSTELSTEPTVRAYIDSLVATIEREREENRDLRERLRRFESEIFKLTAEMQALLSKDSPTGMLSRWVKSKIAS